MWLSIEQLRALPLTQEARLALLRELQGSAPTGAAELQLMAEQAELQLRCCEHAWTTGAWLEALEHHDQLLQLVVDLAQMLPEQAASFWNRYGELLASLTAAVHGAVNSHSTAPPPEPLRSELCWRLAERLNLGRQLPFTPPEWLAVLEQQLVQDGAAYWTALIEAEEGQEPGVARQRAYGLLLRLNQLLAPAPAWVLQQARDHLAAAVEQLLAQPTADAAALAQLCTHLESLPVELEQKQPLAAALLRARLALELLAPELGPLSPRPAVGGSDAQPETSAAGVAALVLLEPGGETSPLQLDVAPLLAGDGEAGFEAIEAALDDFIWHLPRGSRAQPAAPALLAALEPAWRAGLRLPAAAFERLAYLAAAWQRRLAEKLEPLPPIDWQHSLLIELDGTELAVLHPLLAKPKALEPVLAELRREHHNPGFWQERQELPWMQCPPPLEALRRLHLEQGYYAGAHEPLEGLMDWGREVVRALLEAELWTDDAACLGRWLAVAQELVGQQQVSALPPLGAPPAPEQLLAELGGLEVVYVGDRAAAVQEAHRAGRCFQGEPFGLRVLESPASCWPARPAASFAESLAVLLEGVDGLYRQRPFAVLLADCGAYRLPLLRAVHQRYGVAALSSGRPLASWLGA